MIEEFARNHHSLKEQEVLMTLIDNINSFIRSKSNQKKINWFYENHGNGFEKWFQFEVSHWLYQKFEHNVILERQHSVDNRKTDKQKIQIDMAVQIKRQRDKSLWHAVEFKVTKAETGSVRKAVKDLIKLTRMTGSE